MDKEDIKKKFLLPKLIENQYKKAKETLSMTN